MGVEVRRRTLKGVTATRRHIHLLRVGFLLLFSGIALSACSFGDDKRGKAAGPSSGVERISAPVQPSAPTPMDTFRTLAPAEGMKFTRLFAEPLDEPDTRFKRLEDAVQDLRNDFDTVVPSMVRLIAIEKDMKELVRQLQSLTEGPAAAPPEPVEPMPLPEAMPPSQVPPQVIPAPGAAHNAQQNPEMPGEDVAGGTETAETNRAGSKASSSLVTPEAAPKGELPPEGAASPPSAPKAPAVDWQPQDSMRARDAQPLSLAPQTSAPAPAAAPPPSVPAAGSVRGVRVGDHPDKTRVVLDLTAKAGFTASLSKGGKTLVIDIPGMDWSAVRPFEADSAALVAGWRAEGSRLTLDLLYPSTIKQQQMLAPNGSPFHRLVVDLFSADVHG